MKKIAIVVLIILITVSYGCIKTFPETPEIAKVNILENAAPTINITSLPPSVNETEVITIRWKINSEQPLTTAHTAIHYDLVSHDGIFTTEVKPEATGYTFLTKEWVSGEFSIPREFATSMATPQNAETIYLRAHVAINNKNYWTEEKKIVIIKSGCQYNNPGCGENYNCINNQCLLKSGCSYNNPACSGGYSCQNNRCVVIRGGGGGY